MKNLLSLFIVLLILSSCKKKAEDIPVASVTIDKGAAAKVHLGTTLQLTAAVLPENATSPEVSWSSSDPSKATVTGGLVTPLEVGETIISATAGGVTAKCTITVLPPFVAVVGISLNHTKVNIVIKKKRTLKALITPDNASDKTVVWSSDKEDIATVNDQGEITAVASGTCLITAKSSGDQPKTATCEVTVVADEIAVTGISVEPKTANLLVKGTRQLSAKIVPETATNPEVTWSVSEAAVAEVSPEGLVTAKNEGSATVTATSVSNPDKTAVCAITVTNQAVAVTGLTVAPADTSIVEGASFQLRHRIEPATATDVTVTYESGDISKALISESGWVTARAPGLVTLMVQSAADITKKGTCNLTVKTSVKSITVAPDKVSLSIGKKQKLTATVMPSEGADQTVTWKSLDEKIATVSNEGEVTAVALGQVHITATANDGSRVKGEAVVTVRPPATSLTISPKDPKVRKGETLELKATVLPAEAAQAVTWSSGDRAKATINPTTGVATGRGEGTVTITATAADGSEVKAEVTLTVENNPNASDAAITALTLGAENLAAEIPDPGATTTFNNAPRTISTNLAEVQVNITATSGAVIKIGENAFTSGQKVNFTQAVTFSVTEEGKTGSREYTLTIPPYNKSTNPYGIYTAAHLHDMRNAMSEGFKLIKDVTMPTASAGLPGADDYGTKGWLPIGDSGSPFEGTLDGAGHKIDNFYSDQGKEYAGLFGVLGGSAVIKNLEVNTTSEEGKGVTSVNRSGRQYCGILAGQNKGTIEDCHTSGVAASTVYPLNGNAHTGGLVGTHEGGKISRCSSTARVNSNSYLDQCFSGGLVGYNAAEISESYSTGNVHAVASGTGKNAISFAGGLIGNCDGGTLNKCYATGEIDSRSNAAVAENQPGAYAGGLAGRISSTTVSNCYALGNVKAATSTDQNNNYTFTGGFAGRINATAPVNNCYATGYVNSDKAAQQLTGSFVGYLEGWHKAIFHCYRKSGNVTVRGSSKTPEDTKLPAKSIEDMKTDSFKDAVNEGLSEAVWGRSDGKNNNLPYLIGVGVGKD